MTLSVQGLSFGYKDKQVLNEVDFEIQTGKICSLLGANGAGKSTLIKCINGILKPQKGTILANGQNLNNLTHKQRVQNIGYVPQSVQTEDSGLNTLETVLSGRVPYLKGRLKPADYEIAFEALKAMSLETHALKLLGQLSGGERQRVFIARALAQQAKIMLLDEPTSNLDLRFQLETMEIIKELSVKQGITILAIMHDLNIAIAYSDQIIFLKNSRIHYSNVPSKAIRKESVEEVYGVKVAFVQVEGKDYIIPRRLNRG